jgi:hypothetical protein
LGRHEGTRYHTCLPHVLPPPPPSTGPRKCAGTLWRVAACALQASTMLRAGRANLPSQSSAPPHGVALRDGRPSGGSSAATTTTPLASALSCGRKPSGRPQRRPTQPQPHAAEIRQLPSQVKVPAASAAAANGGGRGRGDGDSELRPLPCDSPRGAGSACKAAAGQRASCSWASSSLWDSTEELLQLASGERADGPSVHRTFGLAHTAGFGSSSAELLLASWCLPA